MKKFGFIALLLSAALLQSCSVDLGNTLRVNAESNNYSYSLSENGCSTGEHSFSSQDAMCDGLKNETLNNNCATNLRYLKFQNSCPGRTW